MVLTVSPVPSRSGCFGPRLAQNQFVRFSPIRLLPVILLRVQSDKVKQLLLVAPWWPTQSWFSDLVSLSTGPSWEISQRHDLLTQAQGTIWHPRADLWRLWVWPLSGMG